MQYRHISSFPKMVSRLFLVELGMLFFHYWLYGNYYHTPKYMHIKKKRSLI